MDNLVIKVGKSELIQGRSQSKFLRFFTRPKTYQYYASAELGEYYRPTKSSESIEQLGREMANSVAFYSAPLLTPDLKSPEERKVSGVHGIITGIPLETDELRDFLRGYELQRSEIYRKRDAEKAEEARIAESKLMIKKKNPV